MADAIGTVRKTMQSRIHEIEGEVARLRGALAHLVEGDSTRKSRRSSAPAPSRRGRKVAPRGQRREQLLSHLEKNPGATPAEIAKAIGTTPANVHNVLRKARQDKLVRRNRGGGYELSATAKKTSRAAKPTAKSG